MLSIQPQACTTPAVRLEIARRLSPPACWLNATGSAPSPPAIGASAGRKTISITAAGLTSCPGKPQTKSAPSTAPYGRPPAFRTMISPSSSLTSCRNSAAVPSTATSRLRSSAGCPRPGLGLEIGGNLQDPAVLAHLLGPGLDEEPLDNSIRVCCIFGNASSISTVAATLLGNPFQSSHESSAVLPVDRIGDHDHHRAAVMRDRFGYRRLGPVHG